MGVYYFLLNDTKKKSIHLASHIKYGPMTMNNAVHYAFMNYLMQNQGDSFRIISDHNDVVYSDEYEDLDLLTYQFKDPNVTITIVDKLNTLYGYQRYLVVDGVGVEKDHDE